MQLVLYNFSEFSFLLIVCICVQVCANECNDHMSQQRGAESPRVAVIDGCDTADIGARN